MKSRTNRRRIFAEITAYNDGWMGLRCSYNKDIVSGLKTIPSKERSYNPETKEWTFRESHYNHVRKLVETKLKISPTLTVNASAGAVVTHKADTLVRNLIKQVKNELSTNVDPMEIEL